jgi:hypothetical protein
MDRPEPIPEFTEVTLRRAVDRHGVHMPMGARGVVMAAYAMAWRTRWSSKRLGTSCSLWRARRSRRELRPQCGNASIDPRKLTYLLVDHAGKANFFRLFGFDPRRTLGLAAALRWHIRRRHYDRDIPTRHGMKYEVKCSMSTPDRRNPCILSISIVDAGQTVLRLVTAYANP